MDKAAAARAGGSLQSLAAVRLIGAVVAVIEWTRRPRPAPAARFRCQRLAHRLGGEWARRPRARAGGSFFAGVAADGWLAGRILAGLAHLHRSSRLEIAATWRAAAGSPAATLSPLAR
jgi:hypothetical protein